MYATKLVIRFQLASLGDINMKYRYVLQYYGMKYIWSIMWSGLAQENATQ